MPGFIENNAGYAYTPDTETYHTDFIYTLASELGPAIEIKKRKFTNEMPLYLVGSAERVLYLTWINGDNFPQALMDLSMSGVGFSYAGDAAGANTTELGVVFPFFDARQDQRTRKPVPDSIHKAVVKSQVVTNEVIARIVGHVAKASYVVTLDTHSYETRKSFEANGVELINVSAARLFLDTIQSHNLLSNTLETVIATTDLGDLNRAVAFHRLLPNSDLAIVTKNKTVSESGVESTIAQKLVYGDVRGKRVILFDDLLSSGKTAGQGKDLMIECGAEEVIICVTHPVCIDNYYKTIQNILKDPRVPLIMTTDSLPFEKRRSGGISVPYVNLSPTERKQLVVVPVAPFLANVMKIILEHPSREEAKRLIGDDLMELRDSYELFEEITGNRMARPEDTHIYTEGAQIYPLS